MYSRGSRAPFPETRRQDDLMVRPDQCSPATARLSDPVGTYRSLARTARPPVGTAASGAAGAGAWGAQAVSSWGVRPPLPLPLLLDPDDELPAFGFWFGPVGNEPFLLPLPLPPLPAFGFWFGPVGSAPCVPPPPPPAVVPETGASRARPTVAVAVATPSMMLSRFGIIVAPFCVYRQNRILRVRQSPASLSCFAAVELSSWLVAVATRAIHGYRLDVKHLSPGCRALSLVSTFARRRHLDASAFD